MEEGRRLLTNLMIVPLTKFEYIKTVEPTKNAN